MPITLSLTIDKDMVSVPRVIVEQYLKLASEKQIKVLLLGLNGNFSNIGTISSTLSISKNEVCDAISFWCNLGVLTDEDIPVSKIDLKETKKSVIKAQNTKPSREEIAMRGLETPEIAYLLSEAQIKFGRILRQSEASTLVWLFDDHGMSVSLLLMLIAFAAAEKKCNIGYIERTAIDWIECGVENISDAEERITLLHAKNSAWGIVQSAMGIERRMPSEKELSTAHKWVNEWGYKKDIFKIAYDICVDTTSKFSFAYISKIIDGWHNSGILTAEDVKNIKKPASKKESFATYDISAATAMMLD